MSKSGYVITDQQLYDQIKAKIEEIAEILSSSDENGIGLMSGKSGISLFWAYYSTYSDSSKFSKYADLITECLEEVRDGFTYFTFAGGLSGLGWTLEHLNKNQYLQADTDAILEDIDKYLSYQMIIEMKKGNYDYLHGALGICLYLLERLSNSLTKDNLILLVGELEKSAKISDENFIAWESKVKISSDEDIKCFNLSMSHGIASIIVLLSKLYKEGIETKKVHEMTMKAVNYLVANQYHSFIYRFPAYVDLSGQKNEKRGRLAWCYNDLGVAMALRQAGKAFENNDWNNMALETLFSSTAITDLNKANVLDAGLCHGTAGIAHIYSQLFKDTKNEVFRKAAGHWFQQTLNLAGYKDGLAGFKAFRTPDRGGYQNNYGLLEGIAGIGLAMISAVSDVEADWDRVLLLS